MATKPKGPAAKSGEAQATATYEVVSPLLHGVLVDGQAVETRYEVGDPVELTEAEAAPLLGHTVKVPQDAPQKKAE